MFNWIWSQKYTLLSSTRICLLTFVSFTLNFLSTTDKMSRGELFYKEQNIALSNDLEQQSPRDYHTDAKATRKKLPHCLCTCSETANFSSYYTASAALLYKLKSWSNIPSPSPKLAAELKMKSSVEYFLADTHSSVSASNVSCGMH